MLEAKINMMLEYVNKDISVKADTQSLQDINFTHTITGHKLLQKTNSKL